MPQMCHGGPVWCMCHSGDPAECRAESIGTRESLGTTLEVLRSVTLETQNLLTGERLIAIGLGAFGRVIGWRPESDYAWLLQTGPCAHV